MIHNIIEENLHIWLLDGFYHAFNTLRPVLLSIVRLIMSSLLINKFIETIVFIFYKATGEDTRKSRKKAKEAVKIYDCFSSLSDVNDTLKKG